MCTVCGCSQGETKIEGKPGEKEQERHHGPVPEGHSHHHHYHDHGHPHAHEHDHEHAPDHSREHAHIHDYGQGPARAHAPGLSQARMVQIEQDILSKNNSYAAANRAFFSARGILALNLVSSPGSGKTTLLVRTIEALKNEFPLAVIEGDQQTANDAERIRATGIPAIQINTGKGCHLDAHMVGHAMESLRPQEGAVLFIENVGNLVCPAAFDLGEAHKVVILSVTEGEDKPLKYPDMFHAADLLLISKIDLLPHVDFEIGTVVANARKVNPGIKALRLSAKTVDGLEAWCEWVRACRKLALIGRPELAVGA